MVRFNLPHIYTFQSQEEKKKVSLKKLERTQEIRSEGFAKVAYDPKSVEKFGGIVE